VDTVVDTVVDMVVEAVVDMGEGSTVEADADTVVDRVVDTAEKGVCIQEMGKDTVVDMFLFYMHISYTTRV
jgi:hypothetical protein